MLMVLQRLYQGREIWDDPVGDMPDKEQRVLDVWPVMARALRCGLPLFRMVEEPHHVSTNISGGCYKGIKQRPFL